MGCVLTKEAVSSDGGGIRGSAVVVAEEGHPSCSTSSGVAGAAAVSALQADDAPGEPSSGSDGGFVILSSTGRDKFAAMRVPDGSNPTSKVGVRRKWPPWLSSVAAEALDGWDPCDAGSFQKLSKIGTGTYSNVYKARDLRTGELVALKKVRFDSMDPESVQFMAREISLLRRLGCHPNVVCLRGIAASRVSGSGGLYLVFDYMEHDLAGLAASPDVQLSLPQIKCYMRQLLSGLAHCHSRGVLHRDIKGANLLVSNDGMLKIADFGLACAYEPYSDRAMTSRVVTLWYRAPELLLGATRYGPGVDLWSAGCVMAELLAKQPILPGRTEIDQLNKIFKLCGCPPEQYWDKVPSKLSCPWRTYNYRSRIRESFPDLPPSSLPLVETLLSIDPADRGTAAAGLHSQVILHDGAVPQRACQLAAIPT